MPAAFATCDLCDAHKNDTSGEFRVLPPVFRDFGAVLKFAGPVVTVKCFEDNTPVKAALESPGHGRVLVVDGGGSLRRALVGGNIAAAAARNGWAGIVVDGCVRDSAGLAELPLGVMAITTCPQRPARVGQGTAGEDIVFRGVPCSPGDIVYADEDGVVLMPPA